MKSILFDYIVRNKKNFIIIVILFCVGLVGGIIFINNSAETQKLEINDYIQELVNNIKNTEDVNKLNILFLSIKQNVFFIILVWFLGCTIIGGIFIYIMILYKGFAIGYTISAMIAVLGVKSGTVFAISGLLMQNIIFITAFFLKAENRNKIIQGNLQKMYKFKRRSNKAYRYYVYFNYACNNF